MISLFRKKKKYHVRGILEVVRFRQKIFIKLDTLNLSSQRQSTTHSIITKITLKTGPDNIGPYYSLFNTQGKLVHAINIGPNKIQLKPIISDYSIRSDYTIE